jgi:hypothetical protein
VRACVPVSSPRLVFLSSPLCCQRSEATTITTTTTMTSQSFLWLRHAQSSEASAACMLACVAYAAPTTTPSTTGECSRSLRAAPDNKNHRWMLTNFDCCAMWVRRRACTIHALRWVRNRFAETGGGLLVLAAMWCGCLLVFGCQGAGVCVIMLAGAGARLAAVLCVQVSTLRLSLRILSVPLFLSTAIMHGHWLWPLHTFLVTGNELVNGDELHGSITPEYLRSKEYDAGHVRVAPGCCWLWRSLSLRPPHTVSNQLRVRQCMPISLHVSIICLSIDPSIPTSIYLFSICMYLFSDVSIYVSFYLSIYVSIYLCI